MQIKYILVLELIILTSLIILGIKMGGGKPINVLSATKVNIVSQSATPKINCNYYQASWKQFKRDFLETQFKNYNSTVSANADLDKYFESYQNQTQKQGCKPLIK